MDKDIKSLWNRRKADILYIVGAYACGFIIFQLWFYEVICR